MAESKSNIYDFELPEGKYKYSDVDCYAMRVKLDASNQEVSRNEIQNIFEKHGWKFQEENTFGERNETWRILAKDDNRLITDGKEIVILSDSKGLKEIDNVLKNTKANSFEVTKYMGYYSSGPRPIEKPTEQDILKKVDWHKRDTFIIKNEVERMGTSEKRFVNYLSEVLYDNYNRLDLERNYQGKEPFIKSHIQDLFNQMKEKGEIKVLPSGRLEADFTIQYDYRKPEGPEKTNSGLANLVATAKLDKAIKELDKFKFEKSNSKKLKPSQGKAKQHEKEPKGRE